MPIPLTCAGCKAAFDVPDNLAGKTIRCTSCKAQMTIPANAKKPAPSAVLVDDDEPVTPKPAAKVAARPALAAKPAKAAVVVEETPKPAKVAIAGSKGKPSRRRDDDDDDDDDKPRRKKKAAAGGSNVPLLAGGGLALCALVGLGVWLATKGKKDDTAKADDAAPVANARISGNAPSFGSGGGRQGGGGGAPAGNEFQGDGFTAALPGEPTVTGSLTAPRGKEYQLRTGSGASGGVYQVTVRSLGQVATAAEIPTALRMGVEGAKANAPLPPGASMREQDITMGEFQGKELSAGAGGGGMTVRFYIAHDRLYAVMCAGNNMPPSSPQVQQFMSSFKITYAGPNSGGQPGGEVASGGRVPPGGGGGGLAPVAPSFGGGAPAGGGSAGGPPGGGGAATDGPPGGGAATDGPPGGGLGGAGGPPPGMVGPNGGGSRLPPGGGAGGLAPPPGALGGAGGPPPGMVGPGGLQPPGGGAGGLAPPPGPLGGGSGPPPGMVGPGGRQAPGGLRPPGGLGGNPAGLEGGAGGQGTGGVGLFGDDIVASHSVEPFYAAAFYTYGDKKELITIGGRRVGAKVFGTLRRYKYPDFKAEGVYNVSALAGRAVIDQEKGHLYVAAVPNPPASWGSATVYDRNSGAGSIQVYNLDDVISNKVTSGGDFKPLGSIPMPDVIHGLELSPDGKSLFVLTCGSTAAAKATLHQVDTAERKVTGKTPIGAAATDMRKSADGKSLLVVERAARIDTVTHITRVDMASPGEPKKQPLPGTARDVVETKKEGVYVAAVVTEQNRQQSIKLHLSEGNTIATEIPFPPGSNAATGVYIALDPESKHLFVGSGSGGGLDVYEVGDLSGAGGGLKKLVSARSATQRPVGGYFHVTPDGEHVVFHSGVVLKVSELGKAAAGGGGLGAGVPPGGGLGGAVPPGAGGAIPPGGFVPPGAGGAAPPGGGGGRLPPGGGGKPGGN